MRPPSLTASERREVQMGIMRVGASPSDAFGGRSESGCLSAGSVIDGHCCKNLSGKLLKFFGGLLLGCSEGCQRLYSQSVSLLVFERKRDVAQPGSAPEWGSGGRGFKSRRPELPPRSRGKSFRRDFANAAGFASGLRSNPKRQ